MEGRPCKDTREKVTIYKPRREASEDTNPVDTLISDFQPPELWENKFLLFEQGILWYLVMQPELTDIPGEAHMSVSVALSSGAVHFF